jgi:peroxiredoxin
VPSLVAVNSRPIAPPLALVVAFFAIITVAEAGTYNPDRAIGDVIPVWKGLAGTDGQEHGWEELADHDAVVVIFTCNGCPYAVDHEDRIDNLATRYAAEGGRVAVIAINANQVDEDSLDAMKARTREKNFHFPYLRDTTQDVAKSFGAARTPECFVLDRDRRIVYMGAFDDAPDGTAVGRRFVEEAVEAVLAGRLPEKTETAPVGCLIRSARRRSPR